MVKQGESLRVVETSTLKVEYVKMPVHDLSVSVLYRIVEPIPIVWKTKKVSILHMLNKENEGYDWLRGLALDEWREMLKTIDAGGLPDWMTSIERVELVECVIVPKEQVSPAFGS